MGILQTNTQTSASTGGSSAMINPENFCKCLKRFYAHWKENRSGLWGSPDAVTIATPPPSDDIRYHKAIALNLWLLGFEFPNTVMVSMSTQIHFLCKQKGCNLLEPLKTAVSRAVGTDLVLHPLERGNESASMDVMLQAISAQSKSECPVIGYLGKEKPEGKLPEAWLEKLHGSRVELSDVTNGFSDLLATKDGSEILFVKKAAFLAASVMKKFVVPHLEKVISDEEKVSHSVLMKRTLEAVLLPRKVDVKLKAENVDICYPPLFQSGGKYDFRPCAVGNDDELCYSSGSAIVCSLGARYNNFCSNVARTFLIDGTAEQCNAYGVLRGAHGAAIAALRPGNKAGASYRAAVAVITREAPELVPFLTRTAGAGIGVELRESRLVLNATNDLTLKAGMVLNVSLGFLNVEAKTGNDKGRTFSLLLADTVLVGVTEPEVLTDYSSKADEDAFYFYEEGIEETPIVKPEANLRSSSLARQEIKLPNLLIRPSFGGGPRQLSGCLEASSDGFRYSTSKPGAEVEIMYGNVKHAFFQPGEGEVTTALHFHLHNDIMVGCSRTRDVQFYVEATREAAGDADEVRKQFQDFTRTVHGLWRRRRGPEGLDLRFETPSRELGFEGVQGRASCLITPTPTCLVQLAEPPFLVVSLREVEVVSLERVSSGQELFDMVFVLSDPRRDVRRIEMIPVAYLGRIKGWLEASELQYYECKMKLEWRPILDVILEDPEQFDESGRWKFLDMEELDSETERSDSEEDMERAERKSGSEMVSESESESESESCREDEAAAESHCAPKRQRVQ